MRFIVFLLLTEMVWAQEKPAPQPNAEPKEAAVIQVKTLTGDSFQRLMRLLGVFDVKVQGDSEMRTIVVYAPKNTIEQMRRVIEELDRPGSEAALGRNIDMTLTLLRCSSAPAQETAALPADVEQVARQLRAATQCKDVQLWDTVPMRLREGSPEASDEFRLPALDGRGILTKAVVTARPDVVYAKDKNRYVRFSKIVVRLQIPGAPLSIETAGDFMEGQKTVIGKVSGISERESMYAVIALKILD